MHGVQGALKVFSQTRDRGDILRYPRWHLLQQGQWLEHRLQRGQVQGKRVIAWLSDVGQRDQAEALVGAEVWIARSDLPPPAPGEYYWADLIGCRVVNDAGVELGEVQEMIETGANDVMSLHSEQGGQLVPWAYGSIVTAVDVNERVITVAWDDERDAPDDA